MTSQITLAKKIHIRFGQCRRHLTDIWESYVLLTSALADFHKSVRAGKYSTINLQSVFEDSSKVLAPKDIYGIIQKTKDHLTPRNALIEGVAIFEDYFQDITFMVYMERPQLLLAQDKAATDTQNSKLLDLLVKNKTRNEILEFIAEEKIRGIFYGNPVDFLSKDKAHLGLDKVFGQGKSELLEIYAEIIARRNIHMHNAGRVDLKYLREVKNSQFKAGNKAPILYEYLRKSFNILQVVAAHATESVVANFCSETPRGVNAGRIL